MGDLAEACQRLGSEDWELTIAGADTPTAPFKQSMRLSIEEMFGGDPRARVEEPPGFEERLELMRAHDLFVAPARFELWGPEVLEAMSVGLPVLATPVGGNLEMVEEGVTGWLTRGAGFAALRAGLEEALERVDEVRAVRASGEPRSRALRLTDPEIVRDGYRRLLDGLGPTAAGAPAARPRAGAAGQRDRAVLPGIGPPRGDARLVLRADPPERRGDRRQRRVLRGGGRGSPQGGRASRRAHPDAAERGRGRRPEPRDPLRRGRVPDDARRRQRPRAAVPRAGGRRLPPPAGCRLRQLLAPVHRARRNPVPLVHRVCPPRKPGDARGRLELGRRQPGADSASAARGARVLPRHRGGQHTPTGSSTGGCGRTGGSGS